MAGARWRLKAFAKEVMEAAGVNSADASFFTEHKELWPTYTSTESRSL
jgi:hypothetical protein